MAAAVHRVAVQLHGHRHGRLLADGAEAMALAAALPGAALALAEGDLPGPGSMRMPSMLSIHRRPDGTTLMLFSSKGESLQSRW